MALSGIQIFKLLPKTNCGDCGVPTCLAFAMSLAAGKAELSACPHVSEESQAQLSEASAPPIRPVVIGIGERTAKVGGETVLFRHEKRFENPCAFAMLLSDTDDAADTKLKKAAEVVYERVGLMLRPELIAVKCDSGDGAKFAAAVAKVVAAGDFNLVLMSQDVTVLEVGLKASGDRKPLLYAATADNVDAVAALAKEVYADLRPHRTVQYDDTQSIGRRYRRQDEIGTPYCVTIDFQSLEDNMATVRERDTMNQIRIPIASLQSTLAAKLAGEDLFILPPGGQIWKKAGEG